jgi:rhodanese-related sulfurtransferase
MVIALPSQSFHIYDIMFLYGYITRVTQGGIFLGGFRCLKMNQKPSVIKAIDAKRMLEQGDAILVDCRTLEEYDDLHIPSSVLIPVQSIEIEFQKQFPDLNQHYIIYCRSGVRSKQAQEILTSQGYLHVHDLGGIIFWPYETESNR